MTLPNPCVQSPRTHFLNLQGIPSITKSSRYSVYSHNPFTLRIWFQFTHRILLQTLDYMIYDVTPLVSFSTMALTRGFTSITVRHSCRTYTKHCPRSKSLCGTRTRGTRSRGLPCQYTRMRY